MNHSPYHSRFPKSAADSLCDLVAPLASLQRELSGLTIQNGARVSLKGDTLPEGLLLHGLDAIRANLPKLLGLDGWRGVHVKLHRDVPARAFERLTFDLENGITLAIHIQDGGHLEDKLKAHTHPRAMAVENLLGGYTEEQFDREPGIPGLNRDGCEKRSPGDRYELTSFSRWHRLTQIEDRSVSVVLESPLYRTVVQRSQRAPVSLIMLNDHHVAASRALVGEILRK